MGVHGSYEVSDGVLSKGGVGSIHATDDSGLVFKRYADRSKAPALVDLEKLVEVGRDVLIVQGRVVGETPESSVNWPVDVVVGEGGAVEGVVLPRIPAHLFDVTGGVRGLEFLVMARAKPPGAKGRVALLLRMAEILAFVNGRGLLHGDVNGKNLAWSLAPHPIMYLIDCDGMVPQVPAPRVGVAALGWTDPRLVEQKIPAHDQFSDWYALALAMYRGLLLTPGLLAKQADGTWPAPSKIPPGFAPELRSMIERGLDPLDASRRPSPREWVGALIKEYLPGGRFDETAIDALDKAATPAFVPIPDTGSTTDDPPVPDRQVTPPGPRQFAPGPPSQPYQPRPAPPVRNANQKKWIVAILAVILVPLLLVGINAINTDDSGGSVTDDGFVTSDGSPLPDDSGDVSPAVPLTAEEELTRIATADADFVSSRLLNSWVPQLASATVGGGDVPGQLPAESILARHRQLVTEDSAVLINSDDYVFKSVNSWVSVAPVPFSNADGALDWCASHGLGNDACYAKLITTDPSATPNVKHPG